MTTIVYKDNALYADRKIYVTGSAVASHFFDGDKLRQDAHKTIVCGFTGDGSSYDIEVVADLIRTYEQTKQLPKTNPCTKQRGIVMSKQGLYYIYPEPDEWFDDISLLPWYCVGSGGNFATASYLLGRDIKRIYADTAKYDTLTSSNYDRVRRSELKG
jgi:hypothetical protein